MTNPKVRGIVHLIEDTKTYGQKGFRKRLVVLEQDTGRFTNYIPIEFTNDGCDTVDDLNLGDDIEITYRLSGRKWQKDSQSEVKFFLSAEAVTFQIHKGKQGSSRSEEPVSTEDVNDQFAEAAQEDDIPF